MRFEALRNASLLGLLCVLSLTSSAARRLGAGDARPVTAIEITVEDRKTDSELAPLGKGDTLVIAPGQSVRLRMTCIVGNRREASYYPSTRFAADSDRQVQVDKINEQVGSILVTGLRPHPGPGAHTVTYEILDQSHPIDEKLRTGRIYVRVEEPKPAPTPTPTPPEVHVPPPVPSPTPRPGVTLFVDEHYRGQSARVVEDQSDLRYSQFGNDRLSSIRVDPGCRVTLYRDSGFQGTSSTVDRDAATMDGLAVGNDAVSSLRLQCGGSGRAVVLYADADYRGTQDVFPSGNYDSLAGRGIGNDSASSLHVDPGCRVVLFRDAGFRGASQVFEASVPRLDGTRVGNDSVSSLQVSCD